MNNDNLPYILCGPILRRTEVNSINIWIALSKEVNKVETKVCRANELEISLGTSICQTNPFGKNLHIVLISVTPNKGITFPYNEILCYDITLDGTPLKTLDVGLKINYPPYSLPSFFIQNEKIPLNVLFGSCRKIHGPGQDSLTRGHDVIKEYSTNLHKRPSALFLGGDQIYADDVSSVIMPLIIELGTNIIGINETLFDVQNNQDYKFGSRGKLMKSFGLEDLGHYPDNHLMKFGEFVAMYCLAWNPDVWNKQLIQNAQKQSERKEDFICKGEDEKNKEVNERIDRHKKEIVLVEDFTKKLKNVRRLLANVPTYMIFDDHEITDDWNISLAWREKVIQNPLGYQFLANGMVAYWLFQAWGNSPNQFSNEFFDKVKNYSYEISEGVLQYQTCYDLYGYAEMNQVWDFITPTYPKALFLDTRTRRGYEFESEHGKELSLNDIKKTLLKGTNWFIDFCVKNFNKTKKGNERDVINHFPPQLIRKEHYDSLLLRFKKELKNQTFFIVTATPIFGIQRFEEILRSGDKTFSLYEWDNETWAANYNGYITLLRFIVDQLQPKDCIILSGDVHYGFANKCELQLDNKNNTFIQITSSALKNNPKDKLPNWKKNILEALELNMKPAKKHQELEWIEQRSYFSFEDMQNQKDEIINENNLGLLQFKEGEIKLSLLYFSSSKKGGQKEPSFYEIKQAIS